MIYRFRKGANNLFVRIFLALIALSFVGIGGSAFINGNSTGDIVTFSDTESISFEEFQVARAKEIDLLQRQNNITLSEENIAELNLNHSILKKLITASMIKYLADSYELDISEDKVISYIKKVSFFKNKNGDFDLSIFKASFNNSQKKEEEYLLSVKQHLLASVILNTFMDSFPVPKIMTSNMISYMSENRIVDIAVIDLGFKPKDYKNPKVSPDEIRKFYDENKAKFITPERRSFEYIKVDKNFIQQKMIISDEILKEYFQENKSEFESENFSKVKDAVKEAFIKEKTEELSHELARNLEEDVSNNLSMEEIAGKYNLTINNVSNIALADMSSSDNSDYIELSDNVFDMSETEISYPIEVEDKSEILLAKVNNIMISRDQEFNEVENDIKELIEKRILALENVKALESLKHSYDPKTINKKELNKKGINISNKSFSRADLLAENKLSPELMNAIFTTDNKKTTQLIGKDNKAYFAYINNIKSNKDLLQKLQKTSKERFSDIIKEGIFSELVEYLTKKNKIKISIKDDK